jgi:hypothetical protein
MSRSCASNIEELWGGQAGDPPWRRTPAAPLPEQPRRGLPPADGRRWRDSTRFGLDDPPLLAEVSKRACLWIDEPGGGVAWVTPSPLRTLRPRGAVPWGGLLTSPSPRPYIRSYRHASVADASPVPRLVEALTAQEPVDVQTRCQPLPRLRASGPAGAPVPLPFPDAAQLLTLRCPHYPSSRPRTHLAHSLARALSG